MTTSITTRAGKGSPLTHDEVDANFTNLQTTADGAETTANAALPKAGGTLTGPVTMTGGTVTTSTPLIDATQTWNAAGVTFTGWKLNVTDTASASGSKFADFQISGTPIVWIAKSGAVVVTSPSDTNKAFRLDAAPGGGVRLEYAGNLESRISSSGVDLRSNGMVSWSNSAGQADNAPFTCLARNADGVVEVNNQTAGTFRDLKLRNLLAGGGNGSYIQTPSMTVANLASAATAGAGARAFVTDATATTFLSTVAGGGSNKVPVVSDGTNWLIG